MSGNMRTTWEDMLNKQFPEIKDQSNDNWEKAKDTFVREYVHTTRARDVILCAMEHKWTKPVDTNPVQHSRRYNESMRNTLFLPKGAKPDPSDEELKEWFFRSLQDHLQ